MKSVAEAFNTLDYHYGDIQTVLPRLKQKLDALPAFPGDENKNIMSLLNYFKTARNNSVAESTDYCVLHKHI